MKFADLNNLKEVRKTIETRVASKYATMDDAALTGTPTAPTAVSSANDTQIATTAFVQAVLSTGLSALANGVVFKGTIGSNDGATVNSLPSVAEVGWFYKVSSDGTYAGEVCEPGDVIFCDKSSTESESPSWTVVQGNIDGAVTGPTASVAGHIATFAGVAGNEVQDSGFTIATSVPENAVFTDTDTKNTAGATASTGKKLYIIGSESQADEAQTYTNSGCYIDENGKLVVGGETVSTATFEAYTSEEIASIFVDDEPSV